MRVENFNCTININEFYTLCIGFPTRIFQFSSVLHSNMFALHMTTGDRWVNEMKSNEYFIYLNRPSGKGSFKGPPNLIQVGKQCSDEQYNLYFLRSSFLRARLKIIH